VISSSVSSKIKKIVCKLHEAYEIKCFIMRSERRMGARESIYPVAI